MHDSPLLFVSAGQRCRSVPPLSPRPLRTESRRLMTQGGEGLATARCLACGASSARRSHWRRLCSLSHFTAVSPRCLRAAHHGGIWPPDVCTIVPPLHTDSLNSQHCAAHPPTPAQPSTTARSHSPASASYLASSPVLSRCARCGAKCIRKVPSAPVRPSARQGRARRQAQRELRQQQRGKRARAGGHPRRSAAAARRGGTRRAAAR